MHVLRAANAHRALSLLDDRPINVRGARLLVARPRRARRSEGHSQPARDLPVVFLTSADSAEICAKALKGGAVDYVVKKRNYLEVLPTIISQACPSVADVRPDTRPPTHEVALIGGESGDRATSRRHPSRGSLLRDRSPRGRDRHGERAGRARHPSGERASRGPFVPVNCAEIAETLFESELFGHARGAFTGAVSDRKGLLESAHGGTLLLDEIEDLAPGPQVKLLRVLQSREFKPVGTTRFVRFDARVIAASNQDVQRLVRQERFRADLFFRLDVLRLRVPPLRERREDVPRLVEHAIRRFNAANGTHFGGFSGEANAALMHRPWPGNVRELENLIERTLVNSCDPKIDESGLFPAGDPAGEHTEKQRIIAALDRNRWNREKAARELGLSRVTLWRRMSRYDLGSS